VKKNKKQKTNIECTLTSQLTSQPGVPKQSIPTRRRPNEQDKTTWPGARFEIFVTVVFHIASAVVARSEKEWQPFGDKQEGARLLTFWVRGFFALVGRFHRPPFEKQ